jgi:hypothetical protein
MLKLSFYVPDTALESVKSALFKAGAGSAGHYDQCCWQIQGDGQFRPLKGSHPVIGKTGEVMCLSEWKVEMICADDVIDAAIRALKLVHPYEQVAYQVVQMLDK